MDRRSILRLLSATPFAAPAAAKSIVEENAAKLANVNLTGVGGSGVARIGEEGPTPTQVKAALNFPWVKDQLIESLY